MSQEHEIRTEIMLHQLARSSDRIAAELTRLNDLLSRIAYSLETATESHFEQEPTEPTIPLIRRATGER